MMQAYTSPNGTRFEAGCDVIDVSSNHRPDTNWSFVDAQGHEHRWYLGDQPAEFYRPADTYTTLTLVYVKDGVGYWDDGEEYEFGHHECKQCGEIVERGYTADTFHQYVPGLRWYRVNDQPVTKEEFETWWKREHI